MQDKKQLSENRHGHDGCQPNDKMPNDEVLYDLAALFKVFGDGTRIRILSALFDRELCVYHLSEALGMQQSAVSHQLRVLRTAGLVKARRQGKEMLYSLDDSHVYTIFNEGLHHIYHRNGGNEHA